MDKILGSVLSNGLGVLGGVGTNLINAHATSQANASNLAFQRELMGFNRQERLESQDFNRKMWYEQQAYNSPLNQANRLRAAGINPANALSGTSGEVSGSIPASSPASAPASTPYQAAHYEPVVSSSMISDSLNAFLDAEMKKKQIQAQEINNESLGERLQNQLEKGIADLKKTISETKHTDASTDNLRKDLSIKETQLNMLKFDQSRQSITAQHTDELFGSQLRKLQDEHNRALLDIDAQRMANEIQRRFGLRLASAQVNKLHAEAKELLERADMEFANKKLTDQQRRTEVQRTVDMWCKANMSIIDKANYSRVKSYMIDELDSRIRLNNSSADVNEFTTSALGQTLKIAPYLVGAGALGGALRAGKLIKYFRPLPNLFKKSPSVGPEVWY